MFLQNLRAKVGARLNGDSEAGFTLIELLVVMLILGILAAIAIPAFFNQREKATDAQAKSAARTAETAIETYRTEAGGEYTGATAVRLEEIEPTLEQLPLTVPEASLGENTFKVEVESGTETDFWIERNAEGVSFGCSNPGEGGCPPGEGDWSK
jgi:type IV pilus assembly protein PilA